MTVKMIVKTSDPFTAASGIDDTVHAVYMDCFDAIHADTNAYIAMYMWQYNDSPNTINHCNPKELTDKLLTKIDAYNATASFNILFDTDSMSEDERDAFQEKFVDAGASAFYPKFKAPKQGIDDTVKMHDKTMLFSQLTFADTPKILGELAGQTVEHVIVQASANIWYTQYYQANQVVIYYDNADLYAYTVGKLEAVKADLNKSSLSSFSQHEPASYLVENVKTYALPRETKNIVESILKNIDNDKEDVAPKIRIAMAGFSKSQKGKAIATKLKEIAKTGLNVKLVSRKGKDGMDPEIEAILADSEVDYILLEKSIDSKMRKIHSKFFLFDGNYSLNNAIAKHKIVWAGSLNYTHPALTNNSETLVRMVDDSLYDDLYQSWCQLRYTSSLSEVSACLGYGRNRRVYFFHKNQYVRWKPSFGIETININQACRILGEDGWQALPDSFKNGIDAALWYSHNEHVYFFVGDKYCKWKPGQGTVAPAVRKIGVDGWHLPSEFVQGIDAAIEHPINKHVYFFKGDKYCKWRPDKGVIAPAVRKIGVDGWHLPSEFVQGIDAALSHPDGEFIYFFKDENYCKWKPNEGIVSPSVRQIGAWGWEGVIF